jgi:hypothetical protein
VTVMPVIYGFDGVSCGNGKPVPGV